MTTQTVRDPATGQHPTNTREIAKHWIDGEWIGSDAGSESINPATAEVLGRWADGGEAEARAAVEAARRAFDTSLWPRDRNLRNRALSEMAERFDAHAEELGPLVTKENGKKLSEGMSEATLPSDTLRHTAGQALTELIGNDRDSEYRQIAMVDRDNNAVAHSGASLRKWAGHRIGKACVAFGDGLAGQQVLDAMEAAFEAVSPAGLDEQLLAALEAGRDAGGMAGAKGRLPERSAAMIVWGNRTHNEVDLRVDLHDRAIDELRRIYVDYKPSIAYYDERARNPRNAIPAMEFADMLKNQRQKETA